MIHILAIYITNWNSTEFHHCMYVFDWETQICYSQLIYTYIIKLLLKNYKTHSIKTLTLLNNIPVYLTKAAINDCDNINKYTMWCWEPVSSAYTHLHSFTVTVKHITFKTSAKFRWCKWNNCMSETFFTIIQTQHYHSTVFLLKFCLSSSFSWEIFLFLKL